MQRPTSLSSRIAGYSFRHKWLVLSAWLLVIVLCGIAASSLGNVFTSEQKDISNSDSAQAARLVMSRFGARPLTEFVITRSASQTVDDPAFQQTVAALAGRLGHTSGVARVGTYLDTNDPSLVSADRHAALTTIVLAGDTKAADAQIGGIMDAVNHADHPEGYSLHLVGNASGNHEVNGIINHDLSQAERVGLSIALVVIVLAFGSLVAGVVPLALGFAAIGPALGAVTLISHVYQLNSMATNIITMIGLAVGIDYSLFIIGRYREELTRGQAPLQAMLQAADSSGRAVFFSGITVLLALSAMLFVRINVFMSLGIGAMTVVLFAVAASLTLLPALLGLFGRKINALRVPFLGRARFGARLWGTVTHAVQRRPALFVAGSVMLLLAAAFPLTQISLGSNGVESLPRRTAAYQGMMALQRDFNAGRTDPMHIVVDGDLNDPSTQTAIVKLKDTIAQRSDVQWLGMATDAGNHAAMIEVASNKVGTGADAQQVVRDLRSTLIPQALEGSQATAHLGGDVPAYVDVTTNLDAALPLVFGFVLGLSFILLLMVFRSVVIPAKAILMNLLSVGAAYGLLVAVFQHGFLAKQLGFQQTPQIEFWLPLFLFSILFGLSMDYHVFLLSRVKEEFDRTGDNKHAVAEGVMHTAGMITSAAIIMVTVFAAFSRGQVVMFQQMGFGLAVAIFLDATLIRSLLVPASMQLLGHWNWWMPSWLHWLPKINVEGETIFGAETRDERNTAAVGAVRASVES